MWRHSESDKTWWVTLTRQDVVSHTDNTERGESHWQDTTWRVTLTRHDKPWWVTPTRQDVVSHTDKRRRGESRWQYRTWWDKLTRRDVASHTDKTRRCESHRQDRMWCHDNKTGRGESLWQKGTWCVTPTRQDLRSHTDKTGRQSATVRTTKYNQSRWPVKVDVRSIAPVTILRRRKRLQIYRRYLLIPLIKLTHFTALIILGEECSSWSASQCSFTQSPVNC